MNGFFLVAHYIFLATEIIKNTVQMKYCFLPNTCINALAKTRTKKSKLTGIRSHGLAVAVQREANKRARKWSSIVSFFFLPGQWEGH